MKDKRNIILVYTLSLIFILFNLFFIAREKFYVSLIPVALLFVLLAVFSLDKFIFLIIFFVPLSIPLSEIVPGLNFDMYLPTEPMLFGVLILFLVKLLFERKFDKKILLHPVSIAIYINLAWILITSLTSTMPVVSLKYFLVRLWFLASFYFLASQIFRKFNKIIQYYWVYIIPFIIVIFYTLFQHSKYGLLDQEASNWVCRPFYNDHTSYGAMLAMYLPVIIGFFFSRKFSVLGKMMVVSALTIYVIAFIFSYTRAAWLSSAVTLVIFVLILFKIKFRTVLIVTGVLMALFFVFRTQIFISLEQNRQDASSNLLKQVQSIANISTDASNLERINRWNCALRMFEQRPVFGWGPGTYMFKYAPFQFSYEKTIISTNAGTGGNAHSEYIGPLAESGLLGMLTFLGLIVTVIWTALKVYKKARSREVKIITITSLLGLITYFFHGILNNFLDTDKASAPFWGFIAVIVAFDVYYKEMQDEDILKKPEPEKNQENSSPITEISSK